MAVEVNVAIGVSSTLISLFVVIWCVAIIWYCRGPCKSEENDPEKTSKQAVHENPGIDVCFDEVKKCDARNQQQPDSIETGSVTHIGPI